jgi:hypothetical protein
VDGNDANEGSETMPLKTISAAAAKAQPGDTITVHEGVYRERINPPRGGTSNERRITYQAAPGERVVVKGSERVDGWKKVQDDVWEVVVPNAFFGEFNPYSDLIRGDWFNPRGRNHHTGAVYLNGHWLAEAADKESLFSSEERGEVYAGHLLNVAWMQMIGAETEQVSAVPPIERQGTQDAPSDEGSECIGFIKHNDWVAYEVDFGKSTEHMAFRVASATVGGDIEVHLDAPHGPLLATCSVPGTGGWQAWPTPAAT